LREVNVKSNLLKLSYEYFNEYSTWLSSQDFTQHEIRAQLCRLNHFLVFLSTEFSGNENVFTDNWRRDDALRDYKLYMRRDLKSPANAMQATLDSVDKFFQFIGLNPTRVSPDAAEPTKPLSDDQLYRLEPVMQEKINPRERALVYLMLFAGLIPQECALIELNDVRLSTTSGFVMLGQGENRYQLNLDARCRIAVRDYLQDRARRYPFAEHPAFFVDERGNRLTASSVDLVARQLGREVGLEITAKNLQQTFQYYEAKRQNRALLAAELLSGVVQV
jgi:site-specific recombinase XerD